jgi:hypothetical protein
MGVRVEETIRIDRPAATVWEAIADYAFDLEWREGLTDMTPTPPGPAAMGTKIHEVVHASGRDYVADTVVTGFEEGTSYSFVGSGTIGGIAGGRRVVGTADGSSADFTYIVEMQPRGAMRLMRPILGSMIRKNLRRDLATLKGLLEKES